MTEVYVLDRMTYLKLLNLAEGEMLFLLKQAVKGTEITPEEEETCDKDCLCERS